ncbi:MAG: Bug family tripartite tricarboxylate transporter substrate binding protein [Chloroflexota bacterium]
MLGKRMRLTGLAAAALLTLSAGATVVAQDEYPSGDISIMAPGGAGGGWDGTARAMQRALEGGVIDKQVNVYNRRGAAGTIGLAQFVSDFDGDPLQLMVMGRVMIGGILLNEAPVSLDQITPIASLTTEWEAIAVSADSPYQNLAELVDAFKADPTSIVWVGGSAGSTDHMVVARIAQEAGVSPDQINYIPTSGGGEIVTALISGSAAAGVSGTSEFAGQIESGDLRLLAVSSPERIDGIDAPTIIEASGLPVEVSNWRGVVAAQNITDDQKADIVAMIEAMQATDSWQESLAANNWTDFLQTGAEFEAFLEGEKDTVGTILVEIGLVTE